MNIQFTEVKEGSHTVLPSFSFDAGLTGIYTDIKRTQVIMNQLKPAGYLHFNNDGLALRLTVEETFRYHKDLSGVTIPIEDMIALFGLQHEKKTKVKDLSESCRNCLSFLRPFLYSKDLLIIEEPFDRLDEEGRKVMAQLISRIKEQEKTILLLGHNLEELLIVTEDLYRIDQNGFHKMDFNEGTASPAEEEQPVIRIEKIQTKHEGKTILFNPPEIDYVESVDGSAQVNVAGKGYNCTLTLQELEKQLRPYGFYRCHRSYIVNLQKVREIITWTKNSYSLKLNDRESSVIPLSRAKLAELKELLGVS
ncbi:LytTR family transcriptional regulator DNA-binding domain-containing protein [Jeotgalibacillus salarius]|uniref:LytR family transcriptional regulator n=1 Tax=Jeotgalibacillus salarius TaxID=546023 RepID=A0A4Y8LJ39_9BACL|nr:LytTR family transcriptional regulator DNA-binding domain-containing protein [Jeotgalibacillus salarius]TFE02411.1 LytR family transcriptional regulator [Jeotgalibacillus salarius]